MKKSSFIMAIGILVFSISVFINHAFGVSGSIIDFVMGLGCGIELVGVVLMFIENKKK